jgi:hypothetical protein
MYTAQAAYPKRTGNGVEGGRERTIVVSYTSTAIESGSTINVCTVPLGAILTGVKAECEAQEADTTLKLVYGTTDISAATAVSSVGGDVIQANLAPLLGAATTAATAITAVTGGATYGVGKDIVFTVKYVLD